MIRITNGSRTAIVTKGAFREWYEPMGWKIADESDEKPMTESLPDNDEKSSEIAPEQPETASEEQAYEEQDETEVEIPISEMKLADLKAYAEEHGIDISAAKNKQDIKDIIRAEMEE